MFRTACHGDLQHGAIAPQWVLGAFLVVGGFLGSYCGAHLRRRLPETSLRRLLELIASVVAVRYFQVAATSAAPTSPAPHVTRVLTLPAR
ncbi:MAG: TSUP family transporter [Actinomycetota bacterium]|nr:TSUP family transporter [Actinomycetota bacterium]